MCCAKDCRFPCQITMWQEIPRSYLGCFSNVDEAPNDLIQTQLKFVFNPRRLCPTTLSNVQK